MGRDNALPEVIAPFSRKAEYFLGRDDALPEIICHPYREQSKTKCEGRKNEFINDNA